MMDFDKYKNKQQRPIPPVKPYLKQAATPDDCRAYADQLEGFQKSEEAWREAMRRYHAESGRLFVMFTGDVLAENGLMGHPKAGQVFQLAYAAAACADTENEFKEIARWVVELADLVLK